MITSEPQELSIPSELMNQGINWIAQLGPEVVGTVNGFTFGQSVAFYLKQYGSGDVLGVYSTDKGQTYHDIPKEQIFSTGANDVMWRLTVPASATVQLLTGISNF